MSRSTRYCARRIMPLATDQDNSEYGPSLEGPPDPRARGISVYPLLDEFSPHRVPQRDPASLRRVAVRIHEAVSIDSLPPPLVSSVKETSEWWSCLYSHFQVTAMNKRGAESVDDSSPKKARTIRAAAQRASDAVLEEAERMDDLDEIQADTLVLGRKKKPTASQKRSALVSKTQPKSTLAVKKKPPMAARKATHIANTPPTGPRKVPVIPKKVPAAQPLQIRRDKIDGTEDDDIEVLQVGSQTVDNELLEDVDTDTAVGEANTVSQSTVSRKGSDRPGRVLEGGNSGSGGKGSVNPKRADIGSALTAYGRSVVDPCERPSAVTLSNGTRTGRGTADVQKTAPVPEPATDDLSAKIALLINSFGKQERIADSIRQEVFGMRAAMEDTQSRLSAVEAMMGETKESKEKTPSKTSSTTKPARVESVKSTYESIMDRHVPDLFAYFPSELWSHAIAFAEIEIMFTYSPNATDIWETHLTLCAIMFSRSNNGKKEQFLTDVGKRASEFRRLTLETIIDLARTGTYESEIPQPSDGTVHKKPFWLRPYEKDDTFIQPKHVEAAQLLHESTSTTSTYYGRRSAIAAGAKPSRDDVAVYIMYTLYKKMNTLFGGFRKVVSKEFCEEFGFLLVKWRDCPIVPVNDDTLKMQWGQARANIHVLDISRMKETARDDKPKLSADSMNKSQYRALRTRPEFTLHVSHDILMHNKGKSADLVRGGMGDVPAVYTYEKSVVDACAVTLSMMAGLPPCVDPHKILMYHPNCTRVLYAMAVCLREVVDLYPCREILDGPGAASAAPRKHNPSPIQKAVDWITMLSPGRNVRDRAVQLSTCCIHELDYLKGYKAFPAGEVKMPAASYNGPFRSNVAGARQAQGGSGIVDGKVRGGGENVGGTDGDNDRDNDRDGEGEGNGEADTGVDVLDDRENTPGHARVNGHSGSGGGQEKQASNGYEDVEGGVNVITWRTREMTTGWVVVK